MSEPVRTTAVAVDSPSLVADLITLTKPRIISLLLVTTIAPMFITPAGLPSWSLVGWVALSGYLMAGGANAINMWFDRDIDDKMARTRLRPIPAGRIPAGAALVFGLTLGAVAFSLFWRFVNPLSAWLALSGLAFYVLVYTVWLKRLSPQNIVIGGAAGAFPPLVGWAAMTGSISLGALYLFAIIFYWTPPHFWALALNKQRDYRAAGIPMMPNVHGVHETKRQMLLYTLMLIPLTIMPSVIGITGLVYGVAAVAPWPPLPATQLAHHARRRRDADDVEAVQVLAGLPRAAVRRDGGRSLDPVRAPGAVPQMLILDQPAAPGATPPMTMDRSDSSHSH